jgi:hypothetical protein
MQQTKSVWLLPPRAGFMTRVSLLSRQGTWLWSPASFSDNFTITRLRPSSDLLM